MGVLHRRGTWPVALLMVAASAGGLFGGEASADSCPVATEDIRSAEPSGQLLPDCRAYEQVSPVDKNTTDAEGHPGLVQSSPSGDSVTYYSIAPFPDMMGSTEFPNYLSKRNEGHWSTQGLDPLVESYATIIVLGLTDGNDETVLEVGRAPGRLLAPGAKAEEGNLYSHNNLTGEYRLIAAGVFGATLADATSDGSRVLFSAGLDEGAEVGGVTDPREVPYLFEWNRETGQTSFIGYVNNEVPATGTVAGSNENGSEYIYDYDQNTLSENGSRIFFSELEGGKVYMREPSTNAPKTVEISAGVAQWRAATPSGAFVLYTEGPEDEELYRFNVAKFEESKEPESEALAGAREQLAGTGAKVLGTVGMSNDGSYVYFVAEGKLRGENEGSEVAGEPNLYEWHEGALNPIRFIATLSKGFDSADWLDEWNSSGTTGTEQGYKDSRISLDGTQLLISSSNQLTSYTHVGQNELYLYDATEAVSAANPRCVSCNPAGVPAEKSAFLSSNVTLNFEPGKLNPTMTRNLSSEGTRVFFQTEESLLPQATDGQMNVYEWEREGTGSCAAGAGVESGGCVYLISTGQSSAPSYFGDASENGDNVFFFTRQSLVSQDQDDNADAYDAREGGGIANQNVQPSSPCESEACRGGSSTVSVFDTPASVTLEGRGNLESPVGTTESGPKVSTREQQLVKALKKCRKKPKARRAKCRAQAQKDYGSRETKKNGGRAANV